MAAILSEKGLPCPLAPESSGFAVVLGGAGDPAVDDEEFVVAVNVEFVAAVVESVDVFDEESAVVDDGDAGEAVVDAAGDGELAAVDDGSAGADDAIVTDGAGVVVGAGADESVVDVDGFVATVDVVVTDVVGLVVGADVNDVLDEASVVVDADFAGMPAMIRRRQ